LRARARRVNCRGKENESGQSQSEGHCKALVGARVFDTATHCLVEVAKSPAISGGAFCISGEPAATNWHADSPRPVVFFAFLPLNTCSAPICRALRSELRDSLPGPSTAS
jgi:hypothetical protein